MVTFGEARQGGLEAYIFEEDNNSQQTTVPEKRADRKKVSSANGKALSKDVFSIAGDTTVASSMLNMEGDNGICSICSSVAAENNDEQIRE